MMQIEQLNVEGTSAQGVMLCAPGGEGHPNMIVVPCKAGYLMCGYLNIDAAEKFGDGRSGLQGCSGKSDQGHDDSGKGSRRQGRHDRSRGCCNSE